MVMDSNERTTTSKSSPERAKTGWSARRSRLLEALETRLAGPATSVFRILRPDLSPEKNKETKSLTKEKSLSTINSNKSQDLKILSENNSSEHQGLKNTEGSIMSTATVLAKRGPGRPRKNPVADAATATATETTEAPETPETATETTETVATDAPVKRRPGRPKGSKNKPKVTAPTADTAPVKRGPGRPRKNPEAAAIAPVVKRGPGRPRKNPVEATAAPVKRGPGRPRKNPEATAAPVKRGPGRPRKNPEAATAAPVVKRGPGRPKGSKNKPKVTAPTATTTAPVVKRGPGRPRKNPEAAAPTATATATAGTRPVLANPFKVGDSVLIPSGAVFTSSAPTAKGRQVTKRGHSVTVHDFIPARVQPRKSEKGSNVLVRPPRIRAKGSGGYWKDITLTEKIVKLNGKPVNYENISIKAEELVGQTA